MASFFSRFVVSVFALVLISLPAVAQNNPNNHVRISLLSETSTVVKGQSFDILLEKEMDPHWHTYWKNPGESGFPIQVKWDVPGDVQVSAFRWPVPAALEVQEIMNFVHEDLAYLKATVSVPENFDGDTLDINMVADWLVCKEICIPETGEASLSLPVGTELTPQNQAAFEKANQSFTQLYTGDVEMVVSDADVVLTLANHPFSSDEEIMYFTNDWGLVVAGAPATVSVDEGTGQTQFTFPRSDRDIDSIKDVSGVLAQAGVGYEIDYNSPQIKSEGVVASTQSQDIAVGVWTAILFAFLGGLVLNLMPCVFPILSMKALSLVKIAEKNKAESFKHGLSYTAGILLSFIGLALVIVAIKAGGAEVGWGFQLQNPFVVVGMTWILIAISLNLLGVFDISGRFTQVGSKQVANAHGLTQDFLTGVLAVIVATPCTAPFMGVALGFALVQPAFVTVIIFMALGLGLALPFLLLAVIPGLQKILPKPGAWMDTFKQFLAFPMFATAIWLTWVLVQQVGTVGVISALVGGLIIAFLAWLSNKKPTTLMKWTLIILSIFGLYKSAMMLESDLINEVAYTPAALEQALESGDPVFVNMTAAWCITCKINERVVKSDDIQEAFLENNVQYIEGDWTLMDDDITKYLQSFDRTGVPLYVYYAGEGKDPVVLPQILTKKIIKNQIN